MISFDGKNLEVGDLVAFAQGSPQVFMKGVVSKLGDKKVKITHTHEVGKFNKTYLRYPEQVVFIGGKIDKK